MKIKKDYTIVSENNFSLENISVKKFANLLNSPATEIWMLQAYAYKLLEKGVCYTKINFASYRYFEGVMLREKEEELIRAKNIARAFSENPFYWNNWMGINAEEQTIKGV